MFIIFAISGVSKEQTTLPFAASCFSQQYLYIRTMSGLFICSLAMETDKFAVTVILNLPNNKSV